MARRPYIDRDVHTHHQNDQQRQDNCNRRLMHFVDAGDRTRLDFQTL